MKPLRKARNTKEIADFLAERAPAADHQAPDQDYEAGAFTYELAEQYSMRHNTFRRAELDFSPKTKWAARTNEQKVEALLLFASRTTRRERMEMHRTSESIIKQVLCLLITITTG